MPSSGGTISQTPNIYSNTTKNISDIFVSVTASDGLTINPCIILIEGAPGIGKTVLAKEIAFQWANNKLLSDKKILLLLFLRECNFKSMVSVENLVEHVVGSSEINASLTKYLLRTEGKDLAIVFDGYDEISEEDRKNSIIARIIYRRIFGKCCLVITSRPTASSNLHGIVDCRVEIVGFTEEDRLDYIQTALQGNDDKVKDLVLFLQSNPTINALCYIPLNMTILLCLVEDGIDKLPKTQTGMYKKFIEMTILRFIQKVDTEVFKVITSIADLPRPHDEVFKELTRLAYNALKIDKIVFRLNEIKAVCPNLAMISSNWNGLGLLKAVQHFNAEIGNVTFHFLHFSIQEYMAALYISTLSDKKQIKLLKETFWQHRYYNTWIMYVGITCGNSFALKHFLSGNWFQISTRIFKYSNISRKYLGNKIKCLHLFQCLVESNNEDMIASVSKFFQDNQIDLDRQTLLPSDVNTLGFFFMRSINKRWEMLNLSGCNIGSIGINILCDRFLSKESRDIVFVKTVDFSYNQLNFSSVIQIFDLFKSWHTSQLIIKDSEILQDHVDSDVYKAIEDAFFTSNYDNQVNLELGPFFFGHKINILPLNAVSIKNLYLLNCKMLPATTAVPISELLAKKSLSKIHLINTSLPNQEMKRLCFNFLKTGNPSLFIYNPELRDQDADEICSLISSRHKIPDGIMLIISNSKIQGVINTSTISEQLTKLEILNLAINVNQKRSNHMETLPWKGNLYCDGSNNDFIDHNFIELLHKNKWNWQLRILLKEKDILIAHRINHENISEKIRMYQSLKVIYISNCNITDKAVGDIAAVIYRSTQLQEFDVSRNSFRSTGAIKIAKALQNISTLTKLYLNNNHVTDLAADDIATVLSRNTQLQELDISENNFQTTGAKTITKALQSGYILRKLYISNNNITAEAADDIAAVIYRSTQLQEVDVSRNSFQSTGAIKIAKALQNISTLTKLYLNNNHITDLAADDIATVLSRNTQLQELDISENNFQTTGAKTISKALRSGYILRKLYISNNNITAEAADDIAAVIYRSTQLQEVDVSRNSFQSTGAIKIAKALQNISTLTKLYLNNNYITDLAADDIATVLSHNTQLQELDISENNFQTAGAKTITKALQSGYMLRKLYICNNNIPAEAADDIAAVIYRSTQLQEVDVSRNSFQSTGAIKILKAVQISTITKLHMNGIHFTYDAAADVAAAVSHNTHLQELDISNNQIEAVGIMKIAKALQSNATLKKLYMSRIRITDKAADAVATALSFNFQLHELDISKNILLTKGIKPIAKVLQSIVTLTKLYINENGISDDAADDIAAVIHSNTQLQEFDVSKNTFQVLGTMKIATALSSVSTLTKLYINNNNITSKSADGIAAVICCNTQLQEFDISENKLQATGVMIITKALQSITTLKKLCISNNIYIGKNAYTEGALSDIENTTEKAAYSFAEAVSRNVKLQEIDFSENYFPITGIVKIMQVLQSIFTVNKLYVINNNITEEAANDFAAALAFNTQLQELDISKNNLQTQGTIKIAKALQGIFTLKILRISNNNIADDAADDIAAAVSHSYQLEVFSIGRNCVGAPGMIKIARALQQISTLQGLYINYNHITDEAADDIVAVCSHNTQLRELFINSNLFTDTKIVELKDHCHELNSEIYIRCANQYNSK